VLEEVVDPQLPAPAGGFGGRADRRAKAYPFTIPSGSMLTIDNGKLVAPLNKRYYFILSLPVFAMDMKATLSLKNAL
jgi:hypothetical protein